MTYLAIFFCAVIMGIMCDKYMPHGQADLFGSGFIFIGFGVLFYGVVSA